MHPELLSLCLFMFVTSCSPGPNNIVASYSGFNFGVLKTIPHMCGVIFGFTTLVTIMNFGLVNIFQKYPIIQEVLKYTGTIFLIYLAYKISFSKTGKPVVVNAPTISRYASTQFILGKITQVGNAKNMGRKKKHKIRENSCETPVSFKSLFDVPKITKDKTRIPVKPI